MIKFADSDALCRYVAEHNDGACVLSFSCGKDSIAGWIQLRRFFPRIVPVYLYLVPGLEFVERSIRYYEDFFETHIVRLPHPSLYRLLTNLTFQAPENITTIEDARYSWLQQFDYDDSFAVTKAISGLPDDTHSAIGVRASDSLNRWASIKKYGALNEKRHTFYPIYDWSKDRLIAEIADAGVKLPVDYRWFGRSFDGIDYRFLRPIKENAPKDYARILEWFPLADLELARMRYREEYYA